jgi:hypothetical protein
MISKKREERGKGDRETKEGMGKDGTSRSDQNVRSDGHEPWENPKV